MLVHSLEAVEDGRKEAPPRFELGISCLLDRRFNQLSHGAAERAPEPSILNVSTSSTAHLSGDVLSDVIRNCPAPFRLTQSLANRLVDRA